MLSRSDIDVPRNLDFGEGNGLATGVRMLRSTHLLVRCTFALEGREHRFFTANHKSNSAHVKVKRRPEMCTQTYQNLRGFPTFQLSLRAACPMVSYTFTTRCLNVSRMLCLVLHSSPISQSCPMYLHTCLLRPYYLVNENDTFQIFTLSTAPDFSLSVC